MVLVNPTALRNSTVVNRKKLAIAYIVLVAVFALALFGGAGTVFWLAGWVFMVLFFGANAALALWLLRHDPGLLQERLTGIRKPNVPAWDKVFFVVLQVFFLSWLVVMAFDAVRCTWSHMPGWLQASGTLLLLASFYLFFLTFRANPYLSPAVRIQTERGQTVITSGPYRFVRHPMYAAAIIFMTGTSLLLGSWYGLVMGLFFVVAITYRALQEERLLTAELPGYAEYLEKVRYRYLPLVW